MGEEYNRADYTVGKRVEISGVLTFKKRGDNLYFNMSASSVNLTVASNEDSIKGEMLFRGKTGKNIEEKTDKKGKNFLQFSAFSAEKVNDGFRVPVGTLLEALTVNVRSGCNRRPASSQR